MVIKSISQEQRKKAASARAQVRRCGEEPSLKRSGAAAQAAHVISASNYLMKPTKAGAKALRIEDHVVARTAGYLVRNKIGTSKGERLLHAAHLNFKSATLLEQQAEMIALMMVEPGAEDALEHILISPGPNIIPTRAQMDRVPPRLLELMGVGNHLAFCAWHGDTPVPHCHVCVSRINPETGKRVQLGDGWLLDTIGQAIAQIEYEQGWPPEDNARYRANERGVFLAATGEQVRDARWNRTGVQRKQEAKRESDEREGRLKLSTGAREYERHHRSWSDERAAQLIAWPIIRAAKSWESMHRALAIEGIRFEDYGSGARLFFGDRDCKATTANWAASIKKLAPRLGNFEPRAPDVAVGPYIARFLDGAEAQRTHRAAKAEALAAKEAERAQIASAAAAATGALQREHERLQRVINGESWTGRAPDLELVRSLVGAVHRGARDVVENNRVAADRAARERHRFPHLEAWLSDKILGGGEDEEAAAQKERELGLLGIIVGNNGQQRRPHVHLLNYEVEDDGFERRYLRGGKLRFADVGNRIEVHDALDRESVRDALLVASDKWGCLQLTGSRKFMELAADLAAELDIQIANPELERRIASERTRWQGVRVANAEAQAVIARRAKFITDQWPLLRRENGLVIVSSEMRKMLGISDAELAEPQFTTALRQQFDRQKPVMKVILAEAAERPARLRGWQGNIVIPALGDQADAVRQRNWARDAEFMSLLEQSVVAAEEAERRRYERLKMAAASRLQPDLAKPSAHPMNARNPPALTRGWNGTELSPDQRRKLLAAAEHRLATEDWDPIEYGTSPVLLASGHERVGRGRPASLPRAAFGQAAGTGPMRTDRPVTANESPGRAPGQIGEQTRHDFNRSNERT